MNPSADSPRFADEVRQSARLAAPLAAGHLSHGLVAFVDTVVAGRHGTTTAAADAKVMPSAIATVRAGAGRSARCGGSRCGWRWAWGRCCSRW